MARGASLEYTLDGQTYRREIYVDTIAQPLQLSGSTHQSRLARQFYPRAFAPGDYAVNGHCRSQEEYQELGLFVRRHHRALVNTPSTLTFNRLDVNAAGYRRLMKLAIPREGITVRGWIPQFKLTKKGVHEPAPEFSFNFFVVFDPHAANIFISRQVEKFYEYHSAPGVVEEEVEHNENLESENNNSPGNLPGAPSEGATNAPDNR